MDGGVRIVVGQGRGQRAQQIHAVAGRKHPHQPQHRLGQWARGDELRLQVAELRSSRQPPVPEEEAHLFEGGVSRQLVNVVAAVGEHAAIAVQIADRGRGGDGVFEAGLWASLP